MTTTFESEGVWEVGQEWLGRSQVLQAKSLPVLDQPVLDQEKQAGGPGPSRRRHTRYQVVLNSAKENKCESGWLVAAR